MPSPLMTLAAPVAVPLASLAVKTIEVVIERQQILNATKINEQIQRQYFLRFLGFIAVIALAYLFWSHSAALKEQRIQNEMVHQRMEAERERKAQMEISRQKHMYDALIYCVTVFGAAGVAVAVVGATIVFWLFRKQ
uniref:Uncharacterized protein n=1 Tax=Panagrolaimus davidi TaxID=227884 RepID=A0A914R7J5_9BILA